MSQAGILNAAGSNPAIPTSFVTDLGTAVPSSNVLNILGGTNVNTSGSGNTVTINATGITGPGSTTVGDVVLWNNTTGTVISDAGFGFPLTETHGGTAQTSYTTGDLLYASAANTLSKLPITTYSGANLAFDGTNVSWQNPAKYVYFVDDFITADNNTSISILGWNRIAQNGGGISWDATNTDAARPGIVTCNMTTAGASAGGIYLGIIAFIFGGGNIELNLWCKLSALSDATDTYIARIGFGDSNAGNASTDGAYFEYTHGTNSGNWQIITANNGSRTTANTNTAANTNWNRFTVTCNAAGTSVAYFINGTQVTNSPIIATIPTGAGRSFGVQISITRTAGTTNARTLLVDLVTIYQLLTASR